VANYPDLFASFERRLTLVNAQWIRDQFWLFTARRRYKYGVTYSTTRSCPESFSLGSYLKLTKKIFYLKAPSKQVGA